MVEHVAERAVVEDHDTAQVRLDGAQVLDKGAVPEGAVLPVVPAREVLAVRLQPVYDRVGVLLHRGREDDQVEPLAHLFCPRQRVSMSAQSAG